MTKNEREPPHNWQFAARFRRHAFGWKSQPAVKRVREAVSEIKKVARRDPMLAAEGAVRFLEKVSPAIEHVDSSSGSIGSAVNKAVDALVPIIAGAPAGDATRSQWLDRLWTAFEEDSIPYIERLGARWGEVCGSAELASDWANRLVHGIELSWSEEKGGYYFQGTGAGLSSLLAAGRNEELLALLERAPHKDWSLRRYGVRALIAIGEPAAALEYAETSQTWFDPREIASACEEILLSMGRDQEAYDRYAHSANERTTYLATFRAVVRKYPGISPTQVLTDLVRSTPGEEGNWFAAAKDAGLREEALDLARRSPCDPRTLTRAARDYATEAPAFAMEAGILALIGIAAGRGYEIDASDIRRAFTEVRRAAEAAGRTDEARERLREVGRNAERNAALVARHLNARLEVWDGDIDRTR